MKLNTFFVILISLAAASAHAQDSGRCYVEEQCLKVITQPEILEFKKADGEVFKKTAIFSYTVLKSLACVSYLGDVNRFRSSEDETISIVADIYNFASRYQFSEVEPTVRAEHRRLSALMARCKP